MDHVEAARGVAEVLAADVVARDAKGGAPEAEVALLRESGLLGLLVARELGGAGGSWADALDVVRTLAAADASAAMLLGYHYLHLWRLGRYDNAELAERAARGTVREGWFWGGASNPREPGLTLTPDGDGYLVGGRKGFATGAQVADRIVVSGSVEGAGGKVMVVLDGRAPGVRHAGDWDAFGVRRSASGGVEFDRARVPGEWVVGEVPPGEEAARPDQSLVVPGFQVVFAHLYAGIARGALTAAAEYTRTKTRPWTGSGVETATRDPYILETYGELAAATAAAEALAERARAAFDRAARRGRSLTAGERGETAVAVSTAKVVAQRAVLDVTARVFDVIGARGTAAGAGFDRYWRDARTHTLHDPVAYKLREIGDHALTGALPTPGPYS
ncbi:alkylation response protein AidB-like acyl-CoA dehydrogenase [Thermocatellispora tengchongensis]|uniref:Alkylation response protein AidB-like acyl-CoA dehydrogenase n=1 Tax=Thermocatellispora tengchongensis TaxID=1073253 RepID=A0A840PAJ3_9ACTN|nr:acyl-CoA dehydrogenase family protein [Thermocatellispora tengchongensis]MBB5138404.1 alkylation response protein AidB-like acyl-CoA dehydrogenase [Thermocatellispora tengchongensis]